MNSDGRMRLAAFWFPPGGHGGGWRMPDAVKGSEYTFSHFADIARLTEQGCMDAIFFADTAGISSTDFIARRDPSAEKLTRVCGLEPMSLLPALATLTSHIGVVATGTTTYNEPYHIARRFATLDQISGGRGGWNLVTSQNQVEARNFGFDKHMLHADRYQRAHEFYDVVRGLWDSWDDDGVIEDKESARYYDIGKVQMLDHEGEHFRVRGPLNIPRSPQGRPVVFQAGSSGPGRELAARTADCVFTAQTTIAEAREFYDDVKSLLPRYGRQAADLKVLPGVVPILGRTEEEAQARHREMRSLITDDQAVRAVARLTAGVDLTKFPIDGPLPDLPPNNDGALARQKMMIDLARRENLSIREIGQRFAEAQLHQILCGTPQSVADIMEEWFRAGVCDGFCIIYPYYRRGVTDVVELLVPELQRRGLFRTEYEGSTLRENLGLPRPQREIRPARA
jgi:FMN-dependent oxidoreductase (nitrilotriacetate monooxygenase family)